jgi:hypothetical protein
MSKYSELADSYYRLPDEVSAALLELEAERDRLRDLVRIAYGVWPDVPDEAWLDRADAALEGK